MLEALSPKAQVPTGSTWRRHFLEVGLLPGSGHGWACTTKQYQSLQLEACQMAVTYDQQGNLLISGIDDHDKPWQELFGGCRPEAWLIKQLYVERRYGRRSKRYSLKKKPARRAA